MSSGTKCGVWYERPWSNLHRVLSLAVCDPLVQPTVTEQGSVPRRALAGEEVPMVNLRRVGVDHGGFSFGDAVFHVHQRISEAAAPTIPNGVQSDDEVPCQPQLVHLISVAAYLFRLPADGRLPEVQCGWWVSCLNQTRVTGSTCCPCVWRASVVRRIWSKLLGRFQSHPFLFGYLGRTAWRIAQPGIHLTLSLPSSKSTFPTF